MATLAENAAKVVAAHGALKEALAEKGVEVPEGVRLTDMADLVRGISATPTEPNCPGVSFRYQNLTEFPTGPIVVDWSRMEDFSQCFYYNPNLSSLALPDGFGKAGKYFSRCFAGCASLNTISFPDGFGANAEDVGGCFSGCGGLMNITGAIMFPVSFELDECQLTHESLLNVLNGLVEVEGKTLMLGTAHLMMLTDEEKAIATAKGWTLI